MKRKVEVHVDGNKLRIRRQQMGLSQSMLATDICTQATVSLIEKKNKTPNLNTLVLLANRLLLPVDELVILTEGDVDRQLRLVEENLYHYNFEEAGHLIRQLTPEMLREGNSQQRYNYLYGVITLFGDHQAEEARFYFARVLQPMHQLQDGVHLILAKLGLALSYAEAKQYDRTRVYVREAEEDAKILGMDQHHYKGEDLKWRWFLAKCYLALDEETNALKAIEDAKRLALESGELFLLDEIYATYADCLTHFDHLDREQIFEVENSALALANILGNQPLIDRLMAKNEKTATGN